MNMIYRPLQKELNYPASLILLALEFSQTLLNLSLLIQII